MAVRCGRLVHVGGEEALGAGGVPHEIPLLGELWIGRVAQNPSADKAERTQTVIARPYVSATHCRLWQDQGAVHITDLSSNGTFVNGEIVGKGCSRQLSHGDTVAFVFRKVQKIVYELVLPQPAVVLDDAPQDALVAKLRQEIAELQAKLDATEQTKRQLNAEAESTSTLQRQVQLLQEIRDTNEACIADLTNKLETERRESRTLQRTVQREQAETAALTKQVEEMRQKIRQQVEQMAQLQAQLTAAQENELSAKSALELARAEVKRLTDDTNNLDALNTKCESLQGELERRTGEMQSTKAMLETTAAALQEERQAHADTKQQLAEAQEQTTRLTRQQQELEAIMKARTDQVKELSSQLQSTSSTNSRSRAVIESLEQERQTLLRGISAVQSNDRQRVATCQRTIDDVLDMLTRLTTSVRALGDNIAVDFAPLELEDALDNSCTQNEPASPTPARTAITDGSSEHTQQREQGTLTPPRHPVTPVAGKAESASSLASEEQSQTTSQVRRQQQQQQQARTPPPKRAMAFDSSSEGEGDTQQGREQWGTSPANNATKRARRTRSQTRSQTLSQTQHPPSQHDDDHDDDDVGQDLAQSQHSQAPVHPTQSPHEPQSQQQQEMDQPHEEETSRQPQEAPKSSMAPPQTSSDYDATQMPTSPRAQRRTTRQWPLDSMESDLPNLSSVVGSHPVSASRQPASRQTQSADKHAKASNTTSSSSHIPSEWDVPDLSFSTNPQVASMSRQAQSFGGTQPGNATFPSVPDDEDSAFDDLH